MTLVAPFMVETTMGFSPRGTLFVPVFDFSASCYVPIAMQVFQQHGWQLEYVALQFRAD
jgi:hypothetical protein